MHRESELANPPQLLVREIHLLFVSGSFQVTQTRFVRNAAQFGCGYAQQERSPGLRHKFGNIIAQVVHGLSPARLPWRRFLRAAAPFLNLALRDLFSHHLANVSWSASVYEQIVLGVK
jgi:hypothetical protein